MFKLRSAVVLFLCLCFFGVPAQKKKEIKKYGIRTVTSTKTLGAKTIKDEKLSYDKNGQLTEEIKYGEEGEVVSVTRYRYNAEGDVVEEAEYDGKNSLVEKKTIKYNVLLQKSEELVTGKDGNQIKKITYSYDAKGLRAEKKTYDANNVLVTTKKIVYGYK